MSDSKAAYAVCGYMCIGAALALAFDVIFQDSPHWRTQICICVAFIVLSRFFARLSREP